MKKLENYTKNGHYFTIIRRALNVGLFVGKRIGLPGKRSTVITDTYEVIHIQSHNGREIHGNVCPPAEYPPSNEQWGCKGWTFPNEIAANLRFEKEANQ